MSCLREDAADAVRSEYANTCSKDVRLKAMYDLGLHDWG
jgi:hypothetical protein